MNSKDPLTIRLVGGRSHNHYVPFFPDAAVLQIAGDTYFRVGEPWGDRVMATEDIKKSTARSWISDEAYAAYGNDLIMEQFEKLLLDVNHDALIDPSTIVFRTGTNDRGYILEMFALVTPVDEDDPENNG